MTPHVARLVLGAALAAALVAPAEAQQRVSVYTAHTAEEARDLAAADRCDLLICDITLPGHSGIHLMRELRERHDLKGIAISGFTGKQDTQAAFQVGYNRYLAKPISFSDLLAAIDELTDLVSPSNPHGGA